MDEPLIYALDGVAPRIAADAFIAPGAVIIGDVEIGAGSSVWFGCVVRGDDKPIRIGARTNIQDLTVIHINSEDGPTLIGDDVTVGHAAIIHGCVLEDGAFVGMGATVLDHAVIRAGGMLGACGLLPPGKVIGPGELWTGAPATLRRAMTAEDRERFAHNARHYARNAQRFRTGLVRVR